MRIFTELKLTSFGRWGPELLLIYRMTIASLSIGLRSSGVQRLKAMSWMVRRSIGVSNVQYSLGPITTMCLLCGEMLCSQSYCCQKTVRPLISSSNILQSSLSVQQRKRRFLFLPHVSLWRKQRNLPSNPWMQSCLVDSIQERLPQSSSLCRWIWGDGSRLSPWKSSVSESRNVQEISTSVVASRHCRRSAEPVRNQLQKPGLWLGCVLVVWADNCGFKIIPMFLHFVAFMLHRYCLKMLFVYIVWLSTQE